jgi:hypothetical protein
VSDSHAMPRKKRRVFMWLFITIQALFALWLITGAIAAGNTSGCNGLSAHSCAAAHDTGNVLGIATILVFWCIVDFLTGAMYLVIRLARR